jgi:hypothetical protein
VGDNEEEVIPAAGGRSRRQRLVVAFRRSAAAGSRPDSGIQPGIHMCGGGRQGIRRQEALRTVEITQSEFTPSKEVANIWNAIAKGAKAIVIQPASPEGSSPDCSQQRDLRRALPQFPTWCVTLSGGD